MSIQENRFQAIISHAKEYGFVFNSSEIYDGLSAVYDYGPYGSELKKNIRDYWWKSMTQLHENIVGIDAAIFMHPTTWKASGHVDNFSDPMIDNKESKKRYRVDHLIEGHIVDLRQQAQELMDKGDAIRAAIVNSHGNEVLYNIGADNISVFEKITDEQQTQGASTLYTKANRIYAKAIEIELQLDQLLAKEDYAGLKALIEENKIACQISGTVNWTDIRQFNLMFSTQIGSVAEEAETIYLRPETAQGIFVNFLNVQKTARMKVPFGIAQTGKAFRNEIVARQFIFRMREFEQMEMQFFIRPGTQRDWYEYWKETRLKWHKSLGIPADKYRFHDHVKLAHYADAAVDIEYEFPIGFKEVEGIHSRTDFDLSQHQKYSNKKLQYFDNDINEATGKPYGNYVPYVIETSIGLDRMFLLILSHAYDEEVLTKEDGTQDTRTVMHIPPVLAPIKLAVLPLTKKDGLPEIARAIMEECKPHFRCFYEEKDQIGKRYRRQDAIGTPFCVTIDNQTKDDQMVTIRYRDSMLQERIPISSVKNAVLEAIS